MKKVVIISVVAVILAGSGLGYTFLVSETNLRSYENLNAELQALTADLQSKLSSLEAKVSVLESERALVVRIWFLQFNPDRIPENGNDYLLDVEVRWGGGKTDYVYGRTGHSRFIPPNYLDFALNRNLMGSTVEITIYAYWHIDDYPIDIDPDPSHGRVIFTPKTNTCSGASLTLRYTVGNPPIQSSVNGRDDGFLTDLYNAFLEYKIETLP